MKRISLKRDLLILMLVLCFVVSLGIFLTSKNASAAMTVSFNSKLVKLYHPNDHRLNTTLRLFRIDEDGNTSGEIARFETDPLQPFPTYDLEEFADFNKEYYQIVLDKWDKDYLPVGAKNDDYNLKFFDLSIQGGKLRYRESYKDGEPWKDTLDDLHFEFLLEKKAYIYYGLEMDGIPGEQLVGAKMEIKEGLLYAHEFDTTDALQESNNLSRNRTYEYIEVQAPPGFTNKANPIEFMVDKDGKLQITKGHGIIREKDGLPCLIMTHDKTELYEVNVSAVRKVRNELLADVTIQYIDVNKPAIKKTVITKADASSTIGGLIPGIVYNVKPIKAPLEYELFGLSEYDFKLEGGVLHSV